MMKLCQNMKCYKIFEKMPILTNISNILDEAEKIIFLFLQYTIFSTPFNVLRS